MGKSGSAKGMALVSPSTSYRMGQNEQAADAAQAAVMAQRRAQKEQYNWLKQTITPATVQGLAAFDKDIARQEKNLSRQEQLISQIDPTIIEASQQALRLLRGEQSSTLAPLQNQRAQQRQKLLNTLRAQLGPAAETSSAGRQALMRFDSETDNLFAGAQQQALSNLGGLSAQFSSQRPDMQRELSYLSGLGQQKTGLRFQQAQMLANARAGFAQTAGAQFTGDLLRAQQNASMAAELQGVGTQVAGAYFTGGLSAMGGGGQQKMTPDGGQQQPKGGFTLE